MERCAVDALTRAVTAGVRCAVSTRLRMRPLVGHCVLGARIRWTPDVQPARKQVVDSQAIVAGVAGRVRAWTAARRSVIAMRTHSRRRHVAAYQNMAVMGRGCVPNVETHGAADRVPAL